ncbi:related to nicotinamide mononucleotide permease [Pseudozyma flocculosa]|uniref:Related to nicotinamide mononucleotide permease n=1 Tax=Pseudozyma flocculosa TaxID=84751 RepID=A0A5C3FCS8_9BASI|nr:related to nicotinamide mononucleotide permease [Pseudozyma flocculosa]
MSPRNQPQRSSEAAGSGATSPTRPGSRDSVGSRVDADLGLASDSSSEEGHFKDPASVEATGLVPTLGSTHLTADSPSPDVKGGFVNIKSAGSEGSPHLQYGKLNGNERQMSAPGLTDWLLRRKDFLGDLDSIATQPSVFDDPAKAPYYQPHPQWENLHRFDPAARWTWREEKRLIRKTDWYICCWSIVMFFCLDLDRGNISQANSDNLLPDLGLTTNDYNLGQTLFRLCFFLAELPSQMISKKLGSDVWVPMQLCLWSIFSASQFFMNGRAQFLFFRSMVGALQGGFIADQVLYLSYFYKKTELPLRLALFWLSNSLVDIVGPFLAFGILRMRGVAGREGWRWLFLLEGLATLTIGIFSFVMMPSSPTSTRTWFWRKGWFDEREETIIVNRIIRDDPSKGSMHNRQGLSPKALWHSLKDYDLWPLYLIAFTFSMPSYPVAGYLTINLRQLGFDTFTVNLLSMPAAAIASVTLVTITLLSERFNTRSWIGIVQNVWYLPGFVALYTLSPTANKWNYWAVVTYIIGAPWAHAVQVSWISRQSGSVQTRTVASALYNMFVQLSAIAGANVYQQDDKPLYRKGNLAMIVVISFNICLYGE